MTLQVTERERIEAEGLRVEQRLREAVLTGQRLMIVKAPPGSGKTHLLTRVAAAVAGDPGRLRVAVACQTNSQADDVCLRLGQTASAFPVVRFASSSGTRSPRLPPDVLWLQKADDLPHDNGVVVATSAKWGLIDLHDTFDILFVDEAWQLAHKDFQLLTQVAPRFVLIGDPGQIPPVITVSALRWQTLQQAPHRPAPDVLRGLPGVDAFELQLPATRRLPHDSAAIVGGFYDFAFGSLAGPGERAILASPGTGDAVDRAITHLADASMAVLTVPTPASGPPMEVDAEVAAACVRVVGRVLERRAKYRERQDEEDLVPAEIGIAATHRKMVTAIELALPAHLRGRIRVDTPERWQGLECQLMLAVHPLSGVRQPSEFDLETGRLCVMASRHRGGLVLVTRDHIGSTLDRTIPFARQPVGAPDLMGRGHAQHSSLWQGLLSTGSIFGS